VSEDWEEVIEDAMQAVEYDPHLELADLRKTEAEVFDLHTMKTLSKLISDRYLDTLDFCISTGKEANVFRGTTPDGKYVAVKIYRVNTRTFRAQLDYLVGDDRFSPRGKSKREVITMWASKGVRNLKRLADAGLRVPEPIGSENNVVVMEYVGEGEHVAPMLKNTDIANPQTAYNELVKWLRTAWNDADLVHGDFSPFNILTLPTELVVIDTAQAVPSDHPRARSLLERDIENIADHFESRGANTDPDAVLDQLAPREEAS